VIDFREDPANAHDSMRVSRESASNEKFQYERGDEQKIPSLQGITIVAKIWNQFCI
jgi:hypothetical protein